MLILLEYGLFTNNMICGNEIYTMGNIPRNRLIWCALFIFTNVQNIYSVYNHNVSGDFPFAL